ncbi:MAG: glycoside hydrolase family 9 protein [Thermoflavifilum sp.]|nr:glycoside hydrolase family 9 protein [Thermoflavifilum sp.]
MKKYLLGITLLLIQPTCVWAQFSADSLSPAIRINQVGYPLWSKKIAIVVLPVGYTHHVVEAFLVEPDSNDTLWRGVSTSFTVDPYTGDRCVVLDFSMVKRTGKYTLVVLGVGMAYPVCIAQDPYRQLSKAVLKAYYFQRCSAALLPAFAGQWARAEGHPDTAVYIHPSAASPHRPMGTRIASPGGWYDAGDYNKYIVNSGITMGTLMDAYEDVPHYFDTLAIHIPEHGNGIPDMLNELLWNLRWMLTMQDPFDGGVYHKLSSAEFDGFEMPEADHAIRFVVQKSTAATLDFVAVMAQAARVFKPFSRQLPGLSDSCLQAAQRAWQWALHHPDSIYDQQTLNHNYHPAITTGAYGDRHLQDEWCWAATELWITTRQKMYLPYVRMLVKWVPSVPNWSNVLTMGYFSLLRHQELWPDLPHAFTDSLQSQFLHLADSLLQQSFAAYEVVMGGRRNDFIWGSNAVAANQAIVMLYAWRLTRDMRYWEAAAGNLDYLLGRNATGYCFVTGFGIKSPMHPHHRPSAADGILAPIPGFLVGGPNPGMQDHCPGYPTPAADAAYIDETCAYACNEVAINWNAPLVYLVNILRALAPGFAEK